MPPNRKTKKTLAVRSTHAARTARTARKKTRQPHSSHSQPPPTPPLPLLTSLQLDAVSPKHQALFPRERDLGFHTTADGRRRSSRKIRFPRFLSLPPELMVRVLCHMECWDLLSFLQTGSFARRFFLVSLCSCFVNIRFLSFSRRLSCPVSY